jgi:hypothetical protein
MLYEIIRKRFTTLDIKITNSFNLPQAQAKYLLCHSAETNEDFGLLFEHSQSLKDEKKDLQEIAEFPKYMIQFIDFAVEDMNYSIISSQSVYISADKSFYRYDNPEQRVTTPVIVSCIFIKSVDDFNDLFSDSNFKLVLTDLEIENRILRKTVKDFYEDEIKSLNTLPGLMTTLSRSVITQVTKSKELFQAINQIENINKKMEDVIIALKNLQRLTI